MNGEQPVLRVRDIGVSYWRRSGFLKKERFWALKNVTFDLYHGESLAIIGRNGVGKSTLLKLIADIINPDRGSIVRDKPCSVSLLSLQVGFSGNLSGRDNAILSGMLLGASKCKMEESIAEIVRFAELEDFIDQPVHTYSTGMRARLGFSVAFVVDPDIMLIDETLGVGDIEFQKKSSEAMVKKIKSNKTVVVVSHNLIQLEKLCDRALWIENGESIMVGDISTVLKAYKKELYQKR